MPETEDPVALVVEHDILQTSQKGRLIDLQEHLALVVARPVLTLDNLHTQAEHEDDVGEGWCVGHAHADGETVARLEFLPIGCDTERSEPVHVPVGAWYSHAIRASVAGDCQQLGGCETFDSECP